MSDERRELRAFVRTEEPPPSDARVVLRGGRDTQALLGATFDRPHFTVVLAALADVARLLAALGRLQPNRYA